MLIVGTQREARERLRAAAAAARRRSSGSSWAASTRPRSRRSSPRTTCAGTSDAFVRRLQEWTEGNPFFIERDAAREPRGRCLEQALSRIAVPAGVKALISDRLARPVRHRRAGAHGGVGDRPRVPARAARGADRRAGRAAHRRAGGGGGGRAGRRGRGRRRPLRVHAGARARGALRAPEREPTRAAAQPDRAGARGGRAAAGAHRPPRSRTTSSPAGTSTARARRSGTWCRPPSRRRSRSPTRTRSRPIAARSAR